MSEANEHLIEMGRRIHKRRKNMGLSQEQLADKAGLSAQVISTSERGVKALRPENICKLCNALGVSSDYILYGVYSDKDIDELHDKLRRLTPTQLSRIMGIVDLLTEENEYSEVSNAGE